MQYGKQTNTCSAAVLEARIRLQRDAERAASGCNEGLTTEWIDPMLWGQYFGKASEALYRSFTDEELLDMLRWKADELGRNPSQKDIFCVYRMYIRRRFKNWPRAMLAAGLKKPKQKVQREDT